MNVFSSTWREEQMIAYYQTIQNDVILIDLLDLFAILRGCLRVDSGER